MTSRWIIPRMGNVQTKVVKKIKTHFVLSNFREKSCRLRKHGTAKQVTGISIIRRMHIAFWVTKAADPHSEYVMLTA